MTCFEGVGKLRVKVVDEETGQEIGCGILKAVSIEAGEIVVATDWRQEEAWTAPWPHVDDRTVREVLGDLAA